MKAEVTQSMNGTLRVSEFPTDCDNDCNNSYLRCGQNDGRRIVHTSTPSIVTLSVSPSRESIAHWRQETSQNALPAGTAMSIETSVASLPQGPAAHTHDQHGQDRHGYYLVEAPLQ